jgi:hypothetical protein
MKKIIGSLLVLFISTIGYTQVSPTVYDSILIPLPLQPIAGEAAPVGLYSIDMVDKTMPLDSGYMAGTNCFPVIVTSPVIDTLIGTYSECAVKYSISGTASVVGVYIGVVRNKGTSTVKAKIYSQDPTSKWPGNQLGAASIPKAIDSFYGFGHGQDILNFSTPIVVSNQTFFASVAFPYLGGLNYDTLCILDNHDVFTSSIDSTSWFYSQAFKGSVSIQNKWIPNNNCYIIYPIVNITSTTGIGKITSGNLSLFSASPNPANEYIHVNFALQSPSDIEILVYDLNGRALKTIKTTNLNAGDNSIGIDVSNFAAGSYLYSIDSKGKKIFSKFILAK